MDRYIIGDKIGEGAFGEVYTAKDKLNDCVDALKKFKKGAPGSAIKELEALMKVKHSGIIGCKGLIHSDDGHVWLQTEYCQGGNLDKFWKKRKPDLPIKYQFMKEISGAVVHLHQYGIAHRDLKPENILIALDEEDRPQAKIGDFGVAKIAESKDITKVQYMATKVVGTKFFLAPEVSTGEYTNKADVFSMGIIFRAMVFDRFVTIGDEQYLCDCYYGEGKHPTAWGEALVNDPTLKITTSPKQLTNYRARNILDAMLIADHDARPEAKDVAETLDNLEPYHFYVETSEKAPVRRAQSLPNMDDTGSSAAAGIQVLSLSDYGTGTNSPGEYNQQLMESMRHIQDGLRSQSSTPRSQTRVTTPTRQTPRRTDARLSWSDKYRILGSDESPTDFPDEEPALNSSQLMKTKKLVNLWENAFTQNTSEWQHSQVESTVGRLTQSLDKIGRGQSLNDDEMKSFDSAVASMDEWLQGEEHDSLFD